jgi:LysM repeat protein
MKNILGLLFVLLTFQLFAQPEGAEVEWKDGKKYYVHFVQAGNTLYGLTKLYKVTAEEIVATNPELSAGLKEGQKLLIPAVASAETPVNIKPVSSNDKTHVVEKSETLYGISRKYNVSMEEMVEANPGIENGISIGQTLIIPEGKAGNKPPKAPKAESKIVFYDTTIVHTVLDHETMSSISKRFMVSIEEIQKVNGLKSTKIRAGETLRIPIKKEKISKVEIRQVQKVSDKKVDEELIFKTKNEYNILILLPFSLDKSPDGITSISTEFLMGAQVALDSLERLGLNANVQILDVGVDSAKMKSMLTQKEFKDVDLIIGPLMGKNLDIVARWCNVNKVRMISPVTAQTEILKNNQYAIDAVTSDITLMQGVAKYIVENNSRDQIVLVKTGTKDNELYQAFRKKFMTLSAASSKQKLIEIDMLDLGTHIRKGGNTIFIVPSRDKIVATKFINALNKVASKAGSGTIAFYGMKEWVNFDDIKGFYKNKYQFHFASSNDFNYTYEETKTLLRSFRKEYNSDLSKWGAQGFDITFYFIQTLLMEGKPKAGVMNDINLTSTGSGNGQENKACFILKQVDYEIIKLASFND